MGDPASLVYILLLLGVIGSWVFVQNRQSLGQVAQQALIWALIFVAAIAVVGLWDDIKQTVVPQQSVMAGEGRIEIPQDSDGHYYLKAMVNGAEVTFLVDTGASSIALNQSDARKAGIDMSSLAYLGTAQTANGETRIAFVRLKSLSIGDIQDSNVRAWVNEGALDQSLLGMSYLQRFSKVSFENGTLILSR
ncbi:TIGR02281 family clan AA aspartic protease [Lentibacter algarum]|uniref:retropepsin-like aspartic protease family protein n=1 Tax=Lentibacter algarum TaxID=576131 RepID=UPI001C095653|nr:TIGR02281 family clan AA aspartic protease [Lentibacter algarum]MBU2982670.1 TIGR02281 family clan AA aspartic protease [Lentibacter algarum]